MTRTTVGGRRRRKVVDLDLSPLCQKARFLDYQGWPAYGTCADTAVGAVVVAMERLARHGDAAGDLSCGGLTKSWSVVAVGDDLIVVEQGGDPASGD